MKRAGGYLVLLALLVAALLWSTGAEPAGRWAEVERRDLVLGVEVSGEIVAEQAVELGPPQIRSVWSYKISFMAPEGAAVSAGETVLRFDTSELTRKLQQARSDAEAAAKRYEQRRSDLDIQLREQRLALAEAEARRRRIGLEVDVPAEVQAANELRRARVDYAQAKNEIASHRELLQLLEEGSRAELRGLEEARRQASEQVRDLERQIASMTVTAPRDGTVVYLSDRGGEKKSVGDNAWRMEKVIALPDLGRVAAAGEVREAESGRLAAGQRVSLRLDAYPDRMLEGRVRRVHRTMQTRSPTDPRKVARLDVELEPIAGETVRPGMRFTGKVEVERREEVLAIPLEAVVAGPDGPRAFVRGALRPVPRELRLGARSESHAEVLAGLEEGRQVLLR